MENGKKKKKKKKISRQPKQMELIWRCRKEKFIIVRPPTGVGGILTRSSGRKYILCNQLNISYINVFLLPTNLAF